MPRLLRNPLVLGGLAVLVAVIAAVVVAVFLGGTEGESLTAEPTRQPTTKAATATQTPEALEGMRGLALSTLTVRAGPGSGYISLGIAPRGAEMDVLGKSEDETWLEVSYPPHSQLKGWVSADGVELEGSVASLPIGEPESLVLPSVPTSPSGPAVDEEPESLSTPEAADGPDLVVSGAGLVQGNLVVTITNQGNASADPPIDVAIRSGDGSTLLRLARISQALAAGASVDLDTHYQPSGDQQRVLISVDPSSRVAETNEANNAVIFGISQAQPTVSPTAPAGSPTPTPRSSPRPGTPTATLPTSAPTRAPTATTPTPVPTVKSTPTVGG